MYFKHGLVAFVLLNIYFKKMKTISPGAGRGMVRAHGGRNEGVNEAAWPSRGGVGGII